jgi:hypothetical protein
MSGALLITADTAIASGVRRLALRTGTHLHIQHTGAPQVTGGAEPVIVLLGADLLAAVTDDALPDPSRVVVVSATDPDANLTTAAASRRLPCVLGLHRDEPELRQRLARVTDDVLDRLRAAGYRIGYADPGNRRRGYLPPLVVSDWQRNPSQAVYVNCGRTACGDGVPSLSHATQRSNFRTLHRLFPKVWTDTVSDDVTELGAFVADLPAGAVEALCSLTGTDPVLDPTDHLALVDEEIKESWSPTAAIRLFQQLRPRARQVWDRSSPQQVDDLLWEVVAATGIQPVHDGRTVHWPIAELAPRFAARLMAEFWRTRRDRQYRITRLRPTRPSGHRYAIHVGDNARAAEIVSTRFEAVLWAWTHQQVSREKATSARS